MPKTYKTINAPRYVKAIMVGIIQPFLIWGHQQNSMRNVI